MGQRREDGVEVKGDRGSINHLVNRYAGWIFNDMVKRPVRTTLASPGLSRETLHQVREPWGEKRHEESIDAVFRFWLIEGDNRLR